MKINSIYLRTMAVATSLATACNAGFLDVKPDRQVVVPESVADLLALMDNLNLMAFRSPHGLGVIGAGEYYITDLHYESFSAGTEYNFQKNAYTWEAVIYEGGEQNTDWNDGYKRVLQSNVAIDGLKKISPSKNEQRAWETAMGAALFHRAYAYYSLAQLYCAAYDPSTAALVLGLPLRVEADPTLKIKRANLADTYALICDDLERAADLLPDRATAIKTRPSKQAAYALFTRVMMQMGNYAKARDYALQCLGIGDELIDFNEIDRSVNEPFPRWGIGNVEVLLYDNGAALTMNSTNRTNMDTLLLKSYAPNDLRYETYFRIRSGRTVFKGGYDGVNDFNGLAMDEVYLNAAECLARENNLQQALHYLNRLLTTRHERGTFEPYESLDQEEVLALIIEERKKELVMRGTRWPDIKRLNKEDRFKTTLRRVVAGKEYLLEPNSPKWVWPIPLEAVSIGGYEQNPR